MVKLNKLFTIDDFPALAAIDNDLPVFNNENDGYDDIGWFKQDYLFYLNCLRERYLETHNENYYKLISLLIKGVKNDETVEDNKGN